MADGEAERRPMGAPALQGWRRRLSPPHELGMDLARRDALALLRLSGRLEDTGVAAVEPLVEELLAGDVVSVVCDVSAVTHVGRDAARRLVQAASMRPAAPSPVVLCAVGGQAADVFASVDPAGRLPAFATLPQALAVQSARTQRAELTLSGDTQAPGRARAFGRAVCFIWALDAAVDDVLLVISELVTNAVLHAGAADRLTLQRWDAQLTVAVTDAARSLPAPRPAPPDTESGRGLRWWSISPWPWAATPGLAAKPCGARSTPERSRAGGRSRSPASAPDGHPHAHGPAAPGHVTEHGGARVRHVE